MYTIVRKSTENNNLLLTGIGITLSKKKTNASRMPSEEQLLRMLVRIERALSVIALAQMILTIILTRIKNGK